MIREARPIDIPEIYKISQENSIYAHDISVLIKCGFLVSNYTRQHYYSFLEQGYPLTVAEEDGCIVGFMLLATEKTTYAEDLLLQHLHAYTNVPFIVVKQICVRLQSQNTGVGSQLYQSPALQGDRDVFAAVVHDGPCTNLRSLQFHLKQGFKPIFSYTGADLRKRTVYRKEAKHANELSKPPD